MVDQRTTRRGVLATSGAVSGSIAGCGGVGGEASGGSGGGQGARQEAPGESPGPAQQGGGASSTFDALEAESINDRIEVTTDDDLVAKLQAAEAGDVLVLSPGTHEVDETLRRDVDDLVIVGQGWRSTTVIRTGDFPLVELIGTDRDPGDGDRRRSWTFRGLQLHSNGTGSSDLLFAKYADTHRFDGVVFHGWGATGSNIHAHECWDWKFYGCFFAAGGDPDAGTADIYAYNGEHDNTNNFHFINSRWEKLNSYALFSDTSGGGGARNGRYYLTNCKMHGFSTEEDRTPDIYPIKGTWGTLKICNSHFIGTKRGWIHQDEGDGNTVQLINNNFRRYGEPCLNLNSKENYVANNSFWSAHDGKAIRIGPQGHETTLTGNITGGVDPSVVVEAPRTAVTGNVIDFDGYLEGDRPSDLVGLTIRSPNVTVGDNVVKGSGSHGIVVESDDVALGSNLVTGSGGDALRIDGTTGGTVTGNVLKEADGAGLIATGGADGLAVSGNLVRSVGGDAYALEGENTERAANVSL